MDSLVEQDDFRAFLQSELTRRCKANPRYSLRAFAGYLELDPSFLSKLLSGKRAVTAPVVDSITSKFTLSSEQVEKFKQGLLPHRSKESTPISYQNLTLDHFKIISQWEHFAILELTTVKGFKPSVEWIAHSLGISFNEAFDAVNRLFQNGFLKTDETGAWLNSSGNNTTIHHALTTKALKELQTQLLSKAVEALQNTPLSLRDQSALTLALNSKQLPRAKELLRKFRREFDEILQQDQDHRDSVYQLTVSFFPLTPNLLGVEPPKNQLKNRRIRK
jgi:uncharacterized protein (TIGR02147 family)